LQAVTGLAMPMPLRDALQHVSVSLHFVNSQKTKKATLTPPSSKDFVNNNPAAFDNAYFDFASIRVYQ